MIVVFLGAPGSGKGTQAKDIAANFNYSAISTGDLCRSEISSGSELGLKIKKSVDEGLLVQDEWIVSLLNKAMQENSEAEGFILDGFPRTLPQAEMLKQKLAQQGLRVNAVIELKVELEALVERLTNRYQCSECGANYNKLFKNPKVAGVCDYCQSKDFSTRADDTEEVIRRRFNEYKSLTAPLVPFYNEQNKLYEVEAGKEPEQVYQEICNILKNVLT